MPSSHDLPKDPVILLSFVNTQLRDHYPSLGDFCDDFGADSDALCETLAALDYHYDAAQNRFL